MVSERPPLLLSLCMWWCYHGLSSYSIWIVLSCGRNWTEGNGCQPWCSKPCHLPTIFPLQCDLSFIFLVSPNLLFLLPQFLLVCEFESVLLKRINPWMALFQLSQLLLWSINKKFQKNIFSCFIMWDKAGVKQISPTGRQSPHTHNDSLNHPSHFPERVYGLSATQVNIHLSPAWLGVESPS